MSNYVVGNHESDRALGRKLVATWRPFVGSPGLYGKGHVEKLMRSDISPPASRAIDIWPRSHLAVEKFIVSKVFKVCLILLR